MQPGFLYVLVHPSDPNLYKIGVTVLPPEKRLAQHNTRLEELAGQVVAQTGVNWQLKIYIAVPDPYWAEKAFWQATQYADIPYRNGIEVQAMDWQEVLCGLEAAKLAGLRAPASRPRRNKEWMLSLLENAPIKLAGPYRGLVAHADFRCDNGHVFKEAPGWIEHHRYCPLCESRR